MASSNIQPTMVTFKAGGTIQPYRAVKLTTDRKTVVQAGAGDQAHYIYQGDVAASTGDLVQCAAPGGGALWQIGASMTGPGVKACKSDANGKAVVASDTDWSVGLVEVDASQSSGDICAAYVQPHYSGATQS